MSILALIPAAELADVVKHAAEDACADTTPNGLALRWAVMRLTRHEAAPQTQAETLENAAIEQMRSELEQERIRTRTAGDVLEFERREYTKTKSALKFATERLRVYQILLSRLADWDRHYGTADQQDPALQAALHDARKKLDEIDAEERKP